MKAALVLVAALAMLVLAAAEDKYTTKYDNVDLDEILNNERLFNKYFECLLEDGDGGCTPDGKELKKVLPDAMTSDCSKCNDKQKEGAKKVISFLINKKPENWQQLKKKYDPEGTYSKKYEEELHA